MSQLCVYTVYVMLSIVFCIISVEPGTDGLPADLFPGNQTLRRDGTQVAVYRLRNFQGRNEDRRAGHHATCAPT